MAHLNLKTKKKKEYNPLVTRTVKRETVGKVKCYLKAVKPNPKGAFGQAKVERMWYTQNGRSCTPANYGSEEFKPDKVYYYEVGANDGSYRKCVTREDADKRFVQLVEFKKRQTEIK